MSDDVPSPEKVWAICRYIHGRKLEPCERCPPFEDDPKFGRVRRMCFAMAAEVVNIVETGSAQIERKACHPSELTDRLKAAIRDTQMSTEHDHLDRLMDDEEDGKILMR